MWQCKEDVREVLLGLRARLLILLGQDQWEVL